MNGMIGIKTALLACVFVVVCASGPGADTHAQKGEDLSASGPLSVEIIEFPDLVDATRGRKVPVKVHLPVGGEACPVVVVSHGGGGHWDANYAQAHHLATHGYVVMALEHIGSNTEVLKRGFRFMANLKAMTRDANEVLGRPRDVSFALDRAEAWNRSHDRLRGRMDLEHVGALGHSYGAYTTMAVCGIRPALDWLKPPLAPGRGLGPDLRDKRIDCGVALSPQAPGEPYFLNTSYASLRAPLLGISGTRDMQQGAKPEQRLRAFDLWPKGENVLIWIDRADHFAFSDSSGTDRRMLPSLSRNEVQPLVRAATLLFFNAWLKGDSASVGKLSVPDLKPYLFGADRTFQVLKK